MKREELKKRTWVCSCGDQDAILAEFGMLNVKIATRDKMIQELDETIDAYSDGCKNYREEIRYLQEENNRLKLKSPEEMLKEILSKYHIEGGVLFRTPENTLLISGDDVPDMIANILEHFRIK